MVAQTLKFEVEFSKTLCEIQFNSIEFINIGMHYAVKAAMLFLFINANTFIHKRMMLDLYRWAKHVVQVLVKVYSPPEFSAK